MTSNSGMRIDRVEIRNFGTWDGGPHVFDMTRQGAVITGENGSGKSTMMDALIVLFSSGKSMRFNGAAGDKGGRSIVDYYQGAFAQTTDERAGGARLHSLRHLDNPETTTALLVVLRNDKGDVFSVAKTLFILNGNRKWRYFTGDVDMSISVDFPGWPSDRDMKRISEQRGFTRHENEEEYWVAVAEGLGLDSAMHAKRAFETVHNSMYHTEFTSVTDVVRRHLLPPFNLLETADDLISMLTDHGKVQDEIRQVKRKIASLTAVTEMMDSLEKRLEKSRELTLDTNRVQMLHSYVLLASFRHQARRAALRAQHMAESRDRSAALRALYEEEIRSIRAARHTGSDVELERLQREQQQTLEIMNMRLAVLNDLNHASERVGAGKVNDEAGWKALIQRAQRSAAADADQLKTNAQEMETSQDELRRIKAEIEADKRQLESVMRSMTGVDADLVASRDHLARLIGLTPDKIPFLAEMVQVRANEEMVWGNALNRLLASESTKILVYDDDFPRAKAALGRLQGRRSIRLQKVWGDEAGEATGRAIDKLAVSAAAHKLEVKPGARFGSFTETWLSRVAAHTCIPDEEVGRFSQSAVSPNGTIMHGPDRAERNLGTFRNNLGWDLTSVKEAWENSIKQKAERANALELVIRQINDGNEVMRVREVAAKLILDHASSAWDSLRTDHQEMAIAAIERRIAELSAQMNEDGSQDREKLLEEENVRLEQEIHRFIKEQGSAESTMKLALDQMASARAALADQREAGLSMTRAAYKATRDRLLRASPDPVSGARPVVMSPEISGISAVFRTISTGLLSDAGTTKKAIETETSRLRNLILSHHQNFPEDENSVSSTVFDDTRTARENREHWRAHTEKVTKNDLGEVESRAREFSRIVLTEAIKGMRTHIHGYDKEARTTIARINELMAENVYSHRTGSHARIILSTSRDPYHKDLDRLLDKVFENISTKGDDEFTADVTAVAEYVKDVDNSIQRNRRERLSSLAHRYEARISETVSEADGSLNEINRIDGPKSLSGGERERLVAFLLSAALQTAFTSTTRPERSLRVFVMDEAFKNSTNENTGTSIRVIESFGLQIIVATPMIKLQPFEPVSETLFVVSRPTNRESQLIRMTMREMMEEEDAA